MARRLLAIAAVLLVLALGAPLALDYGWQRDWLRRQVEASLADALGTPVAIGSLEGVLHRGFVANDIRVGEPDTPLVAGLAVEVRFGAQSALGVPLLEVESLVLRGAQVVIRRDASGRWPWEAPAATQPEDTGGFSLPLRAENVRLEAATLRFVEDAERSFEISLETSLRAVALDEAVAVGAAELAFDVAGPEAGGAAWANGTASGSWRDGAWRLAQFEAGGPLFSARAAGHGDVDGIGASTVSLEIPSLAALAERVAPQLGPLAGRIELDAELEGEYARPLGHVTLRGSDLETRDLALDDVLLVARSESVGQVVIEALELAGGLIETRAAPGASIVADGSQARLDALALQQTGSDGRLLVDVALPTQGGAPLAADPATRIRVHAEAWRLEALAPVWALLGIDAAGRLDAELEWTGAARGPRIAARGSLAEGRFVRETLAAEGIALEFDLAGALAAPSGSVSGSVSSLGLEATEYGALDFAVNLDAERAIEIERLILDGGGLPLRVERGARISLAGEGIGFENVVVDSGGQRIALDGAVVDGAGRDVRLVLDEFDVARALETLGELGLVEDTTPLAGSLTGNVLWNGPIRQPELTGALTWSGARIGTFDFDGIEARVATAGTMLDVATQWRRKGADVLTGQADLPRELVFTQPARLLEDARTRIELRTDAFELGALAPLMPPTVSQIGGRLDAHFTARGAQPRAQVAGRIDVRDGAVQLAGLARRRLAPVTLAIALEGERVVLEQLVVGEPGAQLRGEGDLELDAGRVQTFALDLALDEFPIDSTDLVRGVLDGKLRLAGTPSDPVLTGDLDLAQLSVQIPDEDDATLKEIRVVTAAQPGSALEIREEDQASSILDPLRVDVKLRIARNSWARGRGAEVELRGDLQATKAPQAPFRYVGKLETVRGSYRVYGRRFRIERGSAVLDGGAEVDPLVDVRALHRERDVRISVYIEGRLSDVHVRFESDPELSDTDIASYLLFGRPAAETGAGTDVALEAAAAQIAAGAAVREFEQIFGDVIPVDTLDVSVGENNGTTEVRAGAGKYIGDNLFLHYERGFGADPEDELRAEYQLTPNWSVESNVSTEGETGVDLIFEVEY